MQNRNSGSGAKRGAIENISTTRIAVTRMVTIAMKIHVCNQTPGEIKREPFPCLAYGVTSAQLNSKSKDEIINTYGFNVRPETINTLHWIQRS